VLWITVVFSFRKREAVLSQAAAARVQAVKEGKAQLAVVVAISCMAIPIEVYSGYCVYRY
jgi:hypothetical protein